MVSPDSTDIKNQLRQAGLRVTAPRECVRQWLAEHPHAIADHIRSGVAQALGSVVVCHRCGCTDDLDCAVNVRACRPAIKSKIQYHYKEAR
jgi:hypothetical protein